MPNQAITALLEILRPEIGLSKRRLETLCLIVIGMVSARSVNLSHLACERPGTVQTASTYRRLQRFFQHVRLDDDWALPLLIRLLGLKVSWLLALDRTNWQIGKTEVNYLVLAVVTPRFRVPLVWSLIEGRGCSDTEMRIALLKRYLAYFPATTIRLLLADREFAGADRMEFLCKNNVSFAIRVRDNLRITTEDGHDLTLRARLRQARRGRSFRARLGVREDAAASNAPLLNIAAKPLKGEWLIVGTNVAPRTALETYRKRWAIECLFGPSRQIALQSPAGQWMPRPEASILKTHASLIRASSVCSCPSSRLPSAGPDAPPQTSSANTHHRAKATAIMRNPASEPDSTTSETGSDPIPSKRSNHGIG